MVARASEGLNVRLRRDLDEAPPAGFVEQRHLAGDHGVPRVFISIVPEGRVVVKRSNAESWSPARKGRVIDSDLHPVALAPDDRERLAGPDLHPRGAKACTGSGPECEGFGHQRLQITRADVHQQADISLPDGDPGLVAVLDEGRVDTPLESCPVGVAERGRAGGEPSGARPDDAPSSLAFDVPSAKSGPLSTAEALQLDPGRRRGAGMGRLRSQWSRGGCLGGRANLGSRGRSGRRRRLAPQQQDEQGQSPVFRAHDPRTVSGPCGCGLSGPRCRHPSRARRTLDTGLDGARTVFRARGPRAART